MKNNPPGYRWVIAIICFLLFFLVVGLGNMPQTLYIVPVTEHFNFSRGEFSLVFSIITITGLIIQFSYGFLVKRWGVKLIIGLGLPLIPTGYFIFSRATSLSAFYFGAVLIGVGFSCSSITSITILIKNWFDKNQGTILGIIAAGSGLGGSLFSLVIGNRILSHGFQASYLFTALILGSAALPIILFVRSKPGDKERKENKGNQEFELTHLEESQSGSEKGFFKQPHILLALISVFLIGMTISPVIQNTAPYFDEKGFDAIFAAKISSAIFFIQALSKIVLGIFSDKLGIQTSLYIGLGSFIIGGILLILLANAWVAWIYVLFAGIAMCSFAVLVPLYVSVILETKYYEKYIGVFMAIITGGVGVGNPIVNYAYDLTGTYTYIFIVFLLIGAVSVLVTKKSLKLASQQI